ncbi:MAG: rhodanese-like domain-containing protein [Deltaproteobacteria bacterium]|nr:rhodanese-like domain-containing protein [Deltaproteobacteria bacterium]
MAGKDIILTTLRDAVLVVVVSAALALTVNGVREEGIELVASRAYEVFVPCPEPLGEVTPVAPDDPLIGAARTVLVDARGEEEYGQWHHTGSLHIGFDYLEPVPMESVKKLAGSGAAAVVVYGDGDDPDSGREMARELAGRGLRNVYYVEGGAGALKK